MNSFSSGVRFAPFPCEFLGVHLAIAMNIVIITSINVPPNSGALRGSLGTRCLGSTFGCHSCYSCLLIAILAKGDPAFVGRLRLGHARRYVDRSRAAMCEESGQAHRR